MKKNVLLLSLVALCRGVALGQSGPEPSAANPKPLPYRFGLSAAYGFVFKHKQEFGTLGSNRPYNLEAYIGYQTNGCRGWHCLYRYPEVGVAAGMMDFHDGRLGRAWYAYTYFDKALGSLRKTSVFHFKIGFGGAYLTRHFDPVRNPENIAIGSPFNYAFRSEIYWADQLSPHLQVKAGLAITHFSNAAYRIPNAGINIVGLRAGVTYVPQSQRARIQHRDTITPQWHRGWTLHTSAAFTVKEVGQPGGPKHPGLVLSAYGSRRYSATGAWQVGMDATFDTSVQHLINNDWALQNAPDKPDWRRAAALVGHELFLSDRLSLLTHLGIYVYSPYRPWHPVYQRYGLKYYTKGKSGMFGALSLKTHLATADFVEWTVGKRFGKN